MFQLDVIKKILNKAWIQASRKRSPQVAQTRQNMQLVSELICSLDDDPHSHKFKEKPAGISRRTVRRFVNQYLQPKMSKRVMGHVINEFRL